MKIFSKKTFTQNPFFLLLITAAVITPIASLTSPEVLHAQPQPQSAFGQYEPLSPLPNTGTMVGGKTTTNLGAYAEGIFKLLIATAAGLAVIMIMIGGIQYMSTEAVVSKSDARNKITRSLLGLFLAIGAWLILNTINPKLLNFGAVNQIPPTPVIENVSPITSPPATINTEDPYPEEGHVLLVTYRCGSPSAEVKRWSFGPLEERRCVELSNRIRSSTQHFFTEFPIPPCGNGQRIYLSTVGCRPPQP